MSLLKRHTRAALAMLGVLLMTAPALAQLDFETKAPFAVLMDYESGTILFQKNADEPHGAGLHGQADDRRRSSSTCCSPAR